MSAAPWPSEPEDRGPVTAARRVRGRRTTPSPRIFWGSGCIGERLASELGRMDVTTALLVTSPAVAESPGIVDGIVEASDRRVIGTFRSVKPHCPVGSVTELTELIASTEADGLIALGGGSSMVTARAAAILAAEGGDISTHASYISEDGTVTSPRLLRPKIGIVCIPTTPSTAAGKAGAALVGVSGHRRIAVFDPATRAGTVLCEPDLLATAPRRVWLSSALTTLTMAIEGLLAPTATPFSDAELVQSARMILDELRERGRGDADGTALILAAMLCASGTDVTGGGATAAISHEIGWRSSLANGIVDAIVLPHRIEHDLHSSERAVRRVERMLGVTDLSRYLRSVFTGVGVPQRLRHVGVQQLDLPDVLRAACEDFAVSGNPAVGSADVSAILHAAW